MNVVLFCHSLLSDWNHGNAHFLRGVVSELQSRGHTVTAYEPADGWSLSHLLAEHGQQTLEAVRAVYPQLDSRCYHLDTLDLEQVLDGADLVLVHEWNPPELVARIGRHRVQHGHYRLLFHDTHHRAVSEPVAMAAYDLSGYDGALVFGATLAEVYEKRRWANRVFIWHEAADVRVFKPLSPPADAPPGDLVWIGNWGDEERSRELHQFLIEPAAALRLRTEVYGVRYPAPALLTLKVAGISYGGWLANIDVPQTFARFRVTVHVPRRFYADQLPGIPTIRPFEALACGIPLVSAPWDDCEGLFTPGRDFLMARSSREMRAQLAAVLHEPALADSLRRHGRQTILARHTCAQRVDSLLAIYRSLTASALPYAANMR